MKLFLVGLTLVFLHSSTYVEAASTTTIKQRILPADCIFDVVEIGGEQIFNYYTPEACGVPPNPPVVVPPQTQQPGSSADNQIRSSRDLLELPFLANEEIKTNQDIAPDPLTQENINSSIPQPAGNLETTSYVPRIVLILSFVLAANLVYFFIWFILRRRAG